MNLVVNGDAFTVRGEREGIESVNADVFPHIDLNT
jgi:hypothetical protein